MLVHLPTRFSSIVIASVLIFIASGVIIKRDSKSKNEYSKITGVITYYDKVYGELPYRHAGKYRYLKINNYPYVFELFIGKDFGDFKPDFESLDKLRKGDSICIYGYETSDTKRDRINRNVQFIDNNNQLYFKKGDASRIIAITMSVFSFGLLIIGFILLKKGKMSM
jgi:hypothetical protein